jgi:hypothetical protein
MAERASVGQSRSDRELQGLGLLLADQEALVFEHEPCDRLVELVPADADRVRDDIVPRAVTAISLVPRPSQ